MVVFKNRQMFFKASRRGILLQSYKRYCLASGLDPDDPIWRPPGGWSKVYTFCRDIELDICPLTKCEPYPPEPPHYYFNDDVCISNYSLHTLSMGYSDVTTWYTCILRIGTEIPMPKYLAVAFSLLGNYYNTLPDLLDEEYFVYFYIGFLEEFEDYYLERIYFEALVFTDTEFELFLNDRGYSRPIWCANVTYWDVQDDWGDIYMPVSEAQYFYVYFIDFVNKKAYIYSRNRELLMMQDFSRCPEPPIDHISMDLYFEMPYGKTVTPGETYPPVIDWIAMKF